MNIGKIPVNALKRSVLGQIKTKREEAWAGAGIGKDCGGLWFPPDGRLASCVQEAVLCPPGPPPRDAADSFMTLADLVQKCANNLAACGSEPVAVMIVLFLPEGTQEPCVKALMAQAEGKCRELNMQIVGGQTRVCGCAGQVLAAVTGYGRVLREGRHTYCAEPGQDVVLSKWIGLQGTAVIARRNRDRLLKRYPAYLVEEAVNFDRYLSVVPEAGLAAEAGVGAMHDASEGGVLAALWELAEGAGVGLEIDMRKLPLRQETVEVCECCNVNPYELLSGGCLVMTAPDGQGLVRVLEAARIPARIVGKVTDKNSRILVNGDEIRYMDRPRQDSVYGARNEGPAEGAALSGPDGMD